jgi:hypothetical protein
MLKEHSPPKEKASDKAARRWKNADVRKRLKEAQQRPQPVDPNKEPEPADVIVNPEKPNGRIERFERKFAREIRAMLEGHVDKNLALYAIMLHRRKCKLLKEKLRRLKLAQQAQGEAQ